MNGKENTSVVCCGRKTPSCCSRLRLIAQNRDAQQSLADRGIPCGARSVNAFEPARRTLLARQNVSHENLTCRKSRHNKTIMTVARRGEENKKKRKRRSARNSVSGSFSFFSAPLHSRSIAAKFSFTLRFLCQHNTVIYNLSGDFNDCNIRKTGISAAYRFRKVIYVYALSPSLINISFFLLCYHILLSIDFNAISFSIPKYHLISFSPTYTFY